ncbi:MAG: transglycosylase domain-containing protein [Anaerolineae bacterium]|nr:transglycosylase domain-containing protein [Anaerolineae bacterium]
MATATKIIHRRRRRAERQQTRRTRGLFWWSLASIAFFAVVVLPVGAAVAGAAWMYAGPAAEVPSPEASVRALTSGNVTRFFDRTNAALLYSLQDPLGERRRWVELETLPPYVPVLTLLLEDPDFLQSTRFDPLSTGVALWENALLETRPADASITGRLVRNVIARAPMTGETSLNRQRGDEIAMVAEIERQHSPEEILEWHLNTNDYGSEAYGIEAAAQIYLGKRSVDLTLAEAALLAAIPNAAQYNPFEDETAARARGLDALRALRDAGYINDNQLTAAAQELAALTITRGSYVPQLAPDFMAYARRQTETILDSLGYDGRQMVARGGLNVTTTLDTGLYLQAECTLRQQIARLNGQAEPVTALDGSPCVGAAFLLDSGAAQGAPPDSGQLVILDAQTGEIRALAGDVASSEYQPGVTLQPFVYLDAFVKPQRLTSPATMVLDVPASLPGAEEGLIYNVGNPNSQYYGPLNLRSAMGAWLNPPAAETAFRQGMSSIVSTARQLGLNSLNEDIYDLMLLERGGSVAPLDLAYAYSVFAGLGEMRGVPVEPVAGGFRGRDPVAVREITDASGRVLWSYDAQAAAECRTSETCAPILEDGLAYLVNDIYADAETRWRTLGQENPTALSRPAAVVNGLAGDGTGDWTIGYTPQMVTAVHLNRADGSAMGLTPYAVEGAATVWNAVMEYAHTRDGLPALNWERPAIVVEQPVCEISGLLPNGVCPTYREVFRDGMQPRQTDTFWQQYEVNSQTGQLATVSTPAGLISRERFFVPPAVALGWWRDSGQALPPQDYDTVSVPQTVSAVHFTAPGAYSYVGGVTELSGEINLGNLQDFQVSYGQGLNPSQWIDLGGRQTDFDPSRPLATWDTAGLDGLYSLLLTATTTSNQTETDAIQVTVDNQPPAVQLALHEPDRVFRFPDDREIMLDAQATDNIAIARVEFFHNGQLLGSDESWPYQLKWGIDAPGTQSFRAVVFDAVGNRAEGDLTVEVQGAQ